MFLGLQLIRVLLNVLFVSDIVRFRNHPTVPVTTRVIFSGCRSTGDGDKRTSAYADARQGQRNGITVGNVKMKG